MTQFKSFLIPDPAYYDALTGRIRRDAPKLAVVPLAEAESRVKELVDILSDVLLVVRTTTDNVPIKRALCVVSHPPDAALNHHNTKGA